MPQGFKHSPHVFNQVLKEDLSDLRLDSTLMQYVDDLLISSMTLEQCHQDSIKVLNKLAEGGHKASKEKLQYCLPQVEYLGRTISHGMKAISPSQLHSKKWFCATVRFTQICFFKTTQIYFIFLQNIIVWCLSNLNCFIFHFT